jgi:hypothetical protein
MAQMRCNNNREPRGITNHSTTKTSLFQDTVRGAMEGQYVVIQPDSNYSVIRVQYTDR